MINTAETVRQMIRESQFTYDEIADRARVGRSWLDKFMQGRIADPGISKIDRLKDLLEPKQAAFQLGDSSPANQIPPP